jgi:hypothetical protein
VDVKLELKTGLIQSHHISHMAHKLNVFRCQLFSHQKELCNAGPICAVYVRPHLTQKHKCPEKFCKGGYPCFHPFTKCVVCSGPQRDSNRAFPVRIKYPRDFDNFVFFGGQAKLLLQRAKHCRPLPPTHSLSQHSFSENLSFPIAPNVSVLHSSPLSHQHNIIPEPNQMAFTVFHYFITLWRKLTNNVIHTTRSC